MSTICPASRPFCLGTLMIPRMRLRVVCGFGEMMASFSPTSAFSSVLLPALGRPRIQTNPEWKDMGLGYRCQVSGVRCQQNRLVERRAPAVSLSIYLERARRAFELSPVRPLPLLVSGPIAPNAPKIRNNLLPGTPACHAEKALQLGTT